ncbi:MAG: hypothetical protein LW603_07750 [Sediminibacterium sp.]|nr:hypothetical protein [Sediminibacterium sp.]
MKLIRFGKEGKEKPGIHLDGKNYDLSAFIQDYDESFFEQNGLQKLAGIVNEEKLPLVEDGQRIGSPIARPSKILCIG